MPFIEATMIAGYGPDVKARLVTAFTRGVLSVMAANPDGVIVVLREVEPSNWARGGISRIPGPPLAYAVDVARSAAAAIAAGDTEALSKLTGPGVSMPERMPADLTGFDESYATEGSLVFAAGTLDGVDVIDRFHVVAGRIVSHRRWGGHAIPAA